MTNDEIYQSAFNAAPVAELLIAPTKEFTILAVNDSFLRVILRERSELVGKGLFEVFPEDPADTQGTTSRAVRDSLTKVVATHKSDELTMQSHPIAEPIADSSFRYLKNFWSALSSPVFDVNGKLVCISNRAIDVTGQNHEVEEATVRANKERFQLDLSDRIRPLNDPDEVTAVACELLGKQLNAGRVLYGELDESAEFIDMNVDWTNGVMSSMAGRRLTLSTFGAPIIDAARIGQIIAVDDVISDARSASYADAYLSNGVRSLLAIPLMKQGRLRAVLNIHSSDVHCWTELEIALANHVVDQTWAAVERARVYATLRSERDRSQSVFDTMTEGFAMLDANWTVLYINAEGLRIGNRPGQQIVGRNHWEQWPETVGSNLERMYRRVMQTRAPESVEFLHTYSNNDSGWLEVRAYPGVDGGMSIFFRDVNSRKEAEEKLRDANRRKDEFLAMLAHELRNPLAPIGAAAQVLQLGKLDHERVKKTSEVIGRQVNHMTGLIDDLLDVSRVTSGRIELDKVKLDIDHVINDAVEQVNPLIRARRHELVVRHASQSGTICGERKRLVQVVANVLNNAAKYTAEGGHLALTTVVRESDFLIEVTDDGIGMTPEMSSHAFDLFAQAERTSDRSSGGLGLGLPLVKSLVELHGGIVTCKSDGLGKGSTFWIALPLLRPNADPAAVDSVVVASETPAVAHLRILVVDDNVDAAEMLKLVLEASGHDVMVEHGAYSALETSKREQPNVCLLDIGLPDIDGNELARQLRAQPETREAVLVAVTGYGQDRDRNDSLAAGFNHHLIKPVDIAKLASILSTVKRV